MARELTYHRMLAESGKLDGFATPAEFILNYLRRGETTADVARRSGIPVATLRLWERRLIDKRTTYALKDHREPVGAGS